MMQHDISRMARIFVGLQQRLAEFFHELDVRLGQDVEDFYTADGEFLLRSHAYVGRADIARFYKGRAGKIAVEQKDGVRTARHVFMNFRILACDDDSADVRFLLVYFSGEGRPPLFGLTTPTVVADCHMDFRRESDGVWRIARFDSEPLFVGNDPFMKRAVIEK